MPGDLSSCVQAREGTLFLGPEARLVVYVSGVAEVFGQGSGERTWCDIGVLLPGGLI